MIPPQSRRDAVPRRGMLLLLVLSILSLFIVVGGVGILLALRARETARAFAAASASQVTSGPLARAQLDEALLKLIRGPSSGPAGVGRNVTESLLEDKYGGPSLSVTGRWTLTGTTATYMTLTGTGFSFTNPADVAGKVLTFNPVAPDPTGPASYRILRTGTGTTSTNTLLLANVKPNTPLSLPLASGTCEVVINGREFEDRGVNEAYDGFDDKNPFLTQPVLQNSTIASIARPAFGVAGAPCTVDNDGDGVPDGIWLDDVLPPQRTPDGGQLSFSVSYLVLDLDGRINLNAHGSFVRAQLPLDTSQYAKDPATVPVGMGFGPADVDAALALAGQAAGSGTNRWALLLQGGTATRSATASTATQWRPTPLVETTQQGRYTQGTTFTSAAPGNSSLTTGTNPANADFWMLNPVGNSPTDLKARLQVYTRAAADDSPTLVFARPAGAAAWVSGTDTEDIRASGTASHPYAIRLDEDAPRAAGWNAVDALYTVGELERILRPFDSDAATLAPRLASMLDEYAERSRMTVTTDSWDTPAVTGTAASLVVLSGSTVAQRGVDPYRVFSPETVAGLRMNINRPIASGTAARHAYFRHLYSLVMALSEPSSPEGAPGRISPADAAQWAANVIEFRDSDSIMTWYPYDPTPFDNDDMLATGTAPGVWGAERPEIVITKVTSTTGEKVDVTLQRPNWRAELVTGTGATVSGTTELIDGVLGNRAANTLDATKVVSGSAVWMLSGSVSASGSMTSGTGLNTLTPSATAVGPNATVGTVPFTTTSGTVFLLRLADPNRAVVASNGLDKNDYVPVHSGSMATDRGTMERWLHWPNRDFVSHGELMVVPSGRPVDVPTGLFGVKDEAFLALTGTMAVTGTSGTVGPRILDATIVPSRFAAANVTVVSGSTFLAGTGFELLGFGQFSRWREAGRVNVNTILPDSGATPEGGPVWAALAGRTDAANQVTSGTAIQSLQTLLTGTSGGATGPFDRGGDEFKSAFLQRATAIRLANCATIRSHVFAVWITVRITDSSPNAGPPQYARLFAIVDRSIPVGYAPGRNLNVRETIRLQRFLP